MSEITTVKETVTPAIAEQYLRRNMASNRPINSSNVKKYARDMRNGQFHLTHQGIAFNESGELIDGQNRMSAVIVAGVPVDFLVSRGLPNDAVNCIDRGQSRSFTDCANISCPGNDVRSRAMRDRLVSSAVRQLAVCTVAGKTAVSTNEIMRLYDVFGEQIDRLYQITGARRSGCSRAQVLSAAIAAMYCGVTDDVIEKFFNVFRMTDITDCAGYNVNAVLNWRRMIESSRRSGGYLSAKKVLLGTMNAIYNFANNTAVKNAVIPNGQRYDVADVIKPIFTQA